jgi:hypothetical protein
MSPRFPEDPLEALHPSAIHPISTEHITLWGWGVGPRSPFIETDMPHGRSPVIRHLPTCLIATQPTGPQVFSNQNLYSYFSRFLIHADCPTTNSDCCNVNNLTNITLQVRKILISYFSPGIFRRFCKIAKSDY